MQNEDPSLDILIGGILERGWSFSLEVDDEWIVDGARFTVASFRATIRTAFGNEITRVASTPHSSLKGAIRGIMAAIDQEAA